MSKFIVNLRNYERPYYYNGKKTKYSVTFDGRVFNKKTNKEVAYAENSNGYLTFGTSDVKNGLKGPKMVHRFVAETFIPNPENKKQINHKDGNKSNNDSSNLEWCTNSENTKHAWDSGLRKIKGCPKIIVEFNGMKYSLSELSKILNVKYATLYHQYIHGVL